MIYFCYRDTIDWKKKELNIDFFADRKQIKKTPVEQIKKYKEIINKWSMVNKIDYYEFRNILKTISKRTFHDAQIEEISIKDILKLDKKDWLIPFDDDDWFCKNFKKNIEENSDCDFLCGDVARYFIHEGKFELNEGKEEKCKILQSCQYALKIEKIKKMNNDSLNNIIKRHYTVRYEIKINNMNYKYIDKIISSRIMHNGQFSVLHNSNYLEENDFIFRDPPIYAKWCKTYINILNNYTSKFLI
jgi:hypothetical protein